MVNFTLLLLYHRGKSHRYPLDKRLGGPQSRSGERLELGLGCPTRRQSLYRLRYPTHNLFKTIPKYRNAASMSEGEIEAFYGNVNWIELAPDKFKARDIHYV
jgi:hypothetical protein